MDINAFRCPGISPADSVQTKSVVDLIIRFNSNSDTLNLYFPALKPNVAFDVNIISKLSAVNKAALYKVNGLIKLNKLAEAKKEFDKLKNKLTDPVLRRTYFSGTFQEYQTAYTNLFERPYNYVSATGNFFLNNSLTLADVQALDLASVNLGPDFKDISLLVEAFQQSKINELQLGLLDLVKIFHPDAMISMEAGHSRIESLEANLKFFDSLQRRIDRVIGRGIDSQILNGVTIHTASVRGNINEVRENIIRNLKILHDSLDQVSAYIDNNKTMLQSVFLVGNTISSDLKTKGGSILFIDAGYANILVPGISNKVTYIPKLYWGISVYFRPIDKNTRRQSFPKKFTDPPEFYGCNNKKGYGPDYAIASRQSIWQHLSLNIGMTLGGMANKDFENFYNNNSLLLGPAYRFARAFKVSAGLALLKRSSKNPVISDKKIIPGGYLSLSVDIDLIQGLKDITSILFK